MNRDKLKVLYKKYQLTTEDVYSHKHYVIITRSGIEKIAAMENIEVTFKAETLLPNFAVIKATARRAFVEDTVVIETFGSALKGADYNSGNCQSHYVAEMAEKRSMSRAILKLTGFYELGVFGEDESEDFKKK